MFRLGSPPVKIPYTVDCEFVRYRDDGSSSINMDSASYSLNGRKTLLSRFLLGSPFGTPIGRTLDATLTLSYRAIVPSTVSAEAWERVRRHTPRTSYHWSYCRLCR